MATQTDYAAETSAGMPQLEFSTFPNQIFWLVVTLVVIYFILSRIALPRIGGAMAERAGTITKDLAMAEDLKQKAKEAEAAYEKALAEARAEAHQINAAMRTEIQAQLDVEMQKADAEISARTHAASKKLAAIRESALENVRTVATATAQEIVIAMGGTADGKAIMHAVDQQMKG